MPVYYLETSALVKKYRTETGTEVIGELFRHKGDSEIFITSFLTLVEVTSVAARLLRAGSLTQRAHQVMMGNLSRDARQTLRFHSISDGVVSRAINLAQSYALRAPDAIHLSTALEMIATVTDDELYFVGSDNRLNNAGESSGLTVINPEGPNTLDMLRNLRDANP